MDGHAVLVDERAGRAHALNPTGALVWECLDGASDLGALVDDLATEFREPRDAVAAGVVGLARELARLGLLDGFDAHADAWPRPVRTAVDGACSPDDTPSPSATSERCLPVPPNG